jgi:hypothetical protein
MTVCYNCGMDGDEIEEIKGDWNFCTTCTRAYVIGFENGLEVGRRKYETKDPPWSTITDEDWERRQENYSR